MGTQYYIRCLKCNEVVPENGIRNDSSFLVKVVEQRHALEKLNDEHDFPGLISIKYGSEKIPVEWFHQHKGHVLIVVDEYNNFDLDNP